jgi:phosphatidylinositol-3-phosphatase
VPLALVAVLAVGACSSSPPRAAGLPQLTPPSTAGVPVSPGPSATPLGRPAHVVVVVFENKSYAQVQAAQAPWLHALMNSGAVFTNAHAVTHPSQPNYLALFSGSTQGVTDDHCPVNAGDRPNLARSLLDAGFSFTGYSEGLPAAGSHTCGAGRYAAKHNPWVDFSNVPASANQPYSGFPTSFDALPTVSFVIPDLCNDTHDCPIGTGDAWAAAHLDGYRRWASDHHSLLIVTFDENDNSAGNQILTVVSGAGVRAGSYAQPIDHYTVLRAIEDCFGLAPIGASQAAARVTAICPPPSSGP